MAPYEIALILATLLCSLTAGLVFSFAVVVMPGIKSLDDGEFLQAFQAIDRIIQNNNPLFMAVWVGSIIAILGALGVGFGGLAGTERTLLGVAALVYLLGVQLPTFAINIPLNNQLQKLDVEASSQPSRQTARADFEPMWNRWNSIRTLFAVVTVALLLVLLLRL